MPKDVSSKPIKMEQSQVNEESDGDNRVKDSDVSVLVAAIRSAVGPIEVCHSISLLVPHTMAPAVQTAANLSPTVCPIFSLI